MNTDMTESDHKEERSGRIRFRMYLISSAFATFVYVLIGFFLLIVPGVEPAIELWLLSFSAALLATPLVIGTWKLSTTDAPLALWPLGTVVGVIIMLEFALCAVQVVAELLIVLRQH